MNDDSDDGVPGPPQPSGARGDGSVRVVGTAHVSAESVDEVEAVIDEERPDVVAVELDEGRYRQMKGETPDDLDPGDLLQGNTVFQFLAYWMLSYVQTRMGDRFDIEPGAEMLAAVEAAEDLGLDVALVDRDIQTTIQRFWARMSLMEKARMVGALAFGVTDPRIAGVAVGVIAGVLLGPAIALFGGAVGITDAILARVTTGALVGVSVGALVSTLAAESDLRSVSGTAGGALVGSVAGSAVFLTGVGVGTVTGFLSPFVVGAVGSLVLGLLVGVGIGLLAALVMGATGIGLASEADVDDLEGFDPAELTDADVVTAMMEEFRQFSPGGAEALIDERDAFIAHQLVSLREAGFSVVAVVGAGHREGIERYLADPASLPPMESLTGTAKSGGVPWGKVIGYGVTVAFLGFFLLLAMAGVRNEQLLTLFAAWFLINGAFAAGLARLAGARWTSAGVGGLVAWMTSINPALAPGWFTGYMELRHLTVNVADIGRLNELLDDETRPVGDILADMLDVPLFKLIVIVAATNIGSIVATVLFGLYVLPQFFGASDASVTQLMLEGARESARILWATARGVLA
ncbi:TraB/GumN family protein [Halorarum halophilum]|uniref:TraB/GumN family protein n=1 Tax=Halorarum halophilum TaxID=2743090 RepID=A0A7D5L2N6_9EURY|nr:TraB/GumN family protein [Halobaculum halophilum]QLG27043.1 TraB/GumN family protein [Halobaculum halophilum]